MPSKNQKIVGIWLFVCCTMIFAMVVVGGITRLTGSGLSMVDWRPVTGIFPPLSEASWESEFTLYKQSPEYIKINYDFTLEDFQQIYWVEYFHRMLGRLTGIVFFIPFLFFLLRGWLSRNDVPKYIGIFFLGAVQGFMGWYMVKSGLVDNPEVSHYRLTVHLTLAFIIYAAIFWMALGLWQKSSPQPENSLKIARASLGMTALILLQVLLGGLVAGLKAGLMYNTFPLMNGEIVPSGLFFYDPWWRNFFDNPTMVQFLHRIVAFGLLFGVIIFWFVVRRSTADNRIVLASHLLLVVVFIQMSLGITTLLNQVPILLASLHQAFALILFTVSLFINRQYYASRDHRESATMPEQSSLAQEA